MSNQYIKTNKAPEAIGSYSQGVIADGWIFLSGQLPLDEKTMRLVEGGIKEQTFQVLKNLKSILESGGGGFEDVVRVGVFLTDLSYFKEFNEVYKSELGELKPARSTVEVSALPLGSLIEIDLIARVK